MVINKQYLKQVLTTYNTSIDPKFGIEMECNMNHCTIRFVVNTLTGLSIVNINVPFDMYEDFAKQLAAYTPTCEEVEILKFDHKKALQLLKLLPDTEWCEEIKLFLVESEDDYEEKFTLFTGNTYSPRSSFKQKFSSSKLHDIPNEFGIKNKLLHCTIDENVFYDALLPLKSIEKQVRIYGYTASNLASIAISNDNLNIVAKDSSLCIKSTGTATGYKQLEQKLLDIANIEIILKMLKNSTEEYTYYL